ncbi:MAG TPA: cyanophycin synthetase, partial [Oligoflexia bacterium]|nr:cyanophycin synthetase [Oligoflexia bacterium]
TTLRALLSTSSNLITVFGCGGDRDPSKRPIMGQIATTHSDKVWITSDNPRTEDPEKIIHEVMVGAKSVSSAAKIHTEANRRLAIEAALNTLKAGDILLVAGKGHETYQIIGTQKLPFDDRVVAREYLNR